MIQLPIGRSSRIAFSLTFAALLLNAVVGCWTVEQLTRSGDWVAHTYAVAAGIEKALSTLKDAETGVRGFLLTSDRKFLLPYYRAQLAIDAELRYIEEMTADNPVQQQSIRAFRDLMTGRLDALAITLRLAEAHGIESRKYIIAMDQGNLVMAQARELAAQMVNEESRLLSYRDKLARTTRFLAILSSIIGAGLGVAMVATSVYFANEEVAERQRAAAVLARANEDLEERVRLRTIELSQTNAQLSREVEERIRAEATVREFAAGLHRSNQELERFASVASHDLQEPLRKIQAFGDRLNTKLADSIGEQGRDYLDRMLSSANRMRRLIDDLLAFSRVSTKGRSLIPVDLNAIARDVLIDLEARVHETGGRVELGPLPTLLADPLQIRQLFQNLIGNALKFRRPDTPPVVKVECNLVATDATPQNGHAAVYEILVSDNGIGFEEKYLDRIFEVFQRLHGRTEFEGTGMGLAICRRIAERHGGGITARSQPDLGSTFIVRLPAQQPMMERV